MKKIVICDAYSTGAKLASLFREQGFTVTHIRSGETPSPHYEKTFRPGDFETDFGFSGDDYLQASEKISRFAPDFVIAGTESGVVLAEAISHHLSLPSNTIEKSESRRDKFAMIEAVKDAGLDVPMQVKVMNAEDLHYLDFKNFSFPLVVKPANSAGGDGFRICGSREEVIAHSGLLFGQQNAIGETNSSVLIQEYLQGQQYFVNCTSVNGRHYVSEIWKDDRMPGHNGSLVCWKEDLMELTGHVQAELISYTTGVLDALGIREGASHTELKYTDRGPVLIETAARLQGTIDESAVRRCTGTDVVSLTVLRYSQPEVFSELFIKSCPRRASVSCISLISNQEGRIVNAQGLQHIRSLPSFHSAIHLPQVGSRISKTRDLFTSPGIIYLVGDDATISEDHKRIREMELAGEIFHVVE
ncbi:ATP-grasp domain-containing protein [Pantoea allii]|uniref:ATP-grasp domain-containing protein n=1 Tax=Pantoea allii TaxID=574096 RepID=A0ABS6VER1_9GAMM|nr:ATP-grasp domain-containing protein [Pantoea allii]MBW1214612.1 ATP-grasp domain-containing protein [Pantoea allii]MBW1257788.1 ATP-grasp domain-containing protein [Pantoea allii]MBW1267020.1 ATP-grasp domain-containing protein [Pantoea allii]MBW1289135.1 ATP-grasp domain-containing protein [Pantoea allii]